MSKPTTLNLKSRRDYLLILNSIQKAGSELNMNNLRLSNLLRASGELMNNIFKYAGDGQVVITTGVIAGEPAVILKVTDKGPGIENIELALTNGYSTKGFPGMGLSGAKNIVDDFQIKTRIGFGTTVIVAQYIR